MTSVERGKSCLTGGRYTEGESRGLMARTNTNRPQEQGSSLPISRAELDWKRRYGAVFSSVGRAQVECSALFRYTFLVLLATLTVTGNDVGWSVLFSRH